MNLYKKKFNSYIMKIRVIWELNGYIYKLRNISGMICIKMFRI